VSSPSECIVAPRTGHHLVFVRDVAPDLDPVPVACCQCDALIELPRSGEPVPCPGCAVVHRFLDVRGELII